MYLKIVQSVNTSYGSLKEGRGVPQSYREIDDSINIEVNEEEKSEQGVIVDHDLEWVKLTFPIRFQKLI